MKNLITELKNNGLEEVVICPGGRNKKLLDLFYESSLKVHSFFDERSAAFYALGLSHSKNPVAVVTTSGSAVAECLPAVIEAYYQDSLPLIIISADRPKNLRYTGAPQTIPQQSIFSDFVRSKFDLNSEDSIDLSSLKYPCHINISYQDPNPLKIQKQQDLLGDLVILSKLKETDHPRVHDFLKNFSGTIVLEALSNFKESDFKNALVVRQPDQFFKKYSIGSFERVFRFGAVPVLKAWREIDNRESFYLDGYFSGSEKSKEISWEKVKSLLNDSSNFHKEVYDFNKELVEKVDKLKLEFPESEQAQLSKTIDKVPTNAKVFIGNSLPIRELQLTSFDRDFEIVGQRGVNGIDGSLSFALGLGARTDEIWIVLGDLTCLYDMQGFWPSLKAGDQKIRLVLVNNQGGQIFKKIFDQENMVNTHSLDFSYLAKFWDFEHRIFSEKNLQDLPQKVLIELKPNLEDSMSLWHKLEEDL